MIEQLALERARRILGELKRADAELAAGRHRSARQLLTAGIRSLEDAIGEAQRYLGGRRRV